MNKIYKSKWSAAKGAWVACSELAKNNAKSISGAVFIAVTSVVPVSFAQSTCAGYTNDVINPNYSCVLINVSNATFSAGGNLISGSTGGGNQQKNMAVQSPDVVVGNTVARKPYTTAGVAITPSGWDSPGGLTNNTISGQNIFLYLDGTNAGTNAYAGAGAAYGGKIWFNNFTLDVANANNGDLNGVIAGAPFNDKQPNGAAAGLKNYIHIANNYNFKVVKSSLTNTNPATGIRSILNNNGQSPLFGTIAGEYGPQPIVTVDGKYTADITAGYGNGVYVSGKWDQRSLMPTVNLNDTDIKITGSGNALKIGKKDRSIAGVRQIRDGWGAGQLNFKDGATVNIDQTAATGEAIAITYDGSILNAPRVNAFTVRSQGNAIRVGNDILTNSVQASTDLISTQINNANFRTTTPNTSLIQVDPQQKNVSLLFTGANTDLTAASNGYIIDVQGATVANSSSASLVFDKAANTTGLINKTAVSTLNIGLNNASTWTLAEKTSGAIATSTFDNLAMTGGSTLNAFKNTGTAAFITMGNVSSDASIINMSDSKTGDVLTIDGTYTGTNGKLVLDTALGDDTSATDKLVVKKDIGGTTEIDVRNTTGTGALTQLGIKVVQADAASPPDNFTLKGGSITAQAAGKQAFEYKLYQGTNGGIPPWVTDTSGVDANDWYLRSSCSDGSNTTDGSVPSTSSDGLGCVTNDKIVVKGTAQVAKVEGAGGADTIDILDSASVTGDVLGGGTGLDHSADQDTGDTITINTTGTIGGNVDGGAGDDTIALLAGTVKGDVLGGVGNDAITLAGASTAEGVVDGGDGDDTIVWQDQVAINSIRGGTGSDTVTVSASTYDGSQLLDGGDDVGVADGWIDTLNLNGVKVTANGDKITNWEVINLNSSSNLTLTGNLVTGAGAGSNASGNPLGLGIDKTSTLTAGAPAVTVTGDVHSAGTIDLHGNQPGTGTVLTIGGNYTGIPGSTIKMDTYLGDDTSPTDKLIVNNATSGETTIDVIQVAGSPGAATNNGIELVTVKGISDGVFYSPDITVGAYTYKLQKGTRTNPNDPNWYLRSTCNGSSTTGGSTSLPAGALGCASDDAITVQDNANVAKVEGAGGRDTIVIAGNAVVTGGVYGAGQGHDNSAASDSNDTITVQDNAQVGSIVGGFGADTIIVNGNASVLGGIYGDNEDGSPLNAGNDTVTVNTSGSVKFIDTGDGDDAVHWTKGTVSDAIAMGKGSDTLNIASTAGYTGSQLLDGGDDVGVADGWIDTINLNGVKVTANGDKITNWEVINLNSSSNLTLTGKLVTGAGTGSNASGNPLGLGIDKTSTLTAGAPAVTVTGDVHSAGTIDLHGNQPATGTVLTVGGNYTGVAGSKLLVDTVWNNPNASTSDLLKITGSASGNTVVQVPGGIFGDVAQGEADKVSVPVVDVGQAHADTVFTGSASTTNAGEAQLVKEGNRYVWKLLARKPDGGTVNIDSQAVPGYVLAQQANLEMGFTQLGKLHERVGEQQTWVWDNCGTRCQEYEQFKREHNKKYPVWGRINMDNLRLQGNKRFGMKSKSVFIQFGVDAHVANNLDTGSHRHTGPMLTYGWGSADYFDRYRAQNGVVVADKFTGSSRTDMLSLGGYSTAYAKNGAYLDLVGNVSLVRNKYSSRDGVKASQSGWGLGLSAEVGRPWQIGQSNWLIEPQAQLSYQMMRLNGFNDGTRSMGATQTHNLRGRVGGRLAWNAQQDNPSLRTKTVYFTANVLHDFLPSKVDAAIGRDTLTESFGRTWAEVGLGGQVALSKSTYLYGDIRYDRALGRRTPAGLAREGYHGRVGIRHTW